MGRIVRKGELNWKSESGVSLVGVIVSVGILSAVAVFTSQSFRTIQSSSRVHKSTQAAADVESSIVSAFINVQKTYLWNKCATALPITFVNIPVGTQLTLNQQPLKFYTSNRALTTAPPEASQDVSRCVGTRTYNGTNPATSSVIYQCLRIDSNDISNSNDSFGTNLGAFVEFYVKIKDLRTNTAMTCLAAGPSTVGGNNVNMGNGLEVYYNLHWVVPDTAGKTIYKSKAGLLNVAL